MDGFASLGYPTRLRASLWAEVPQTVAVLSFPRGPTSKLSPGLTKVLTPVFSSSSGSAPYLSTSDQIVGAGFFAGHPVAVVLGHPQC